MSVIILFGVVAQNANSQLPIRQGIINQVCAQLHAQHVNGPLCHTQIPQPPPKAPTVQNQHYNTNIGVPVTIFLSQGSTDPIPNDKLQFSVLGGPTSSTITTPGGTVEASFFFDNHIVAYVPNSNFVGQDSFQYQATDGEGVKSNIGTVTVTVSP